MAIDRRALLAGAAGLIALGPRLAPATPKPIATSDGSYLSARRRSDGTFSVARFNQKGAMDLEVGLPARAHAAVARPGTAEFVVLARRPDRFGLVQSAGRDPWIFEAANGRHFYGHGAYSSDGRLLYTTENDIEAGRGVIGVRDAADGYRQVGELPSHGIGPHELVRLPGRDVLVVGNGGILTHPDYGRAKLNLPDMAPSLAYVDAKTGVLLQETRLAPDLHRLSIRHLAVGRDDSVAFAAQYEGPANDLVPLVGLDRPGAPARLLAVPSEVWRSMRHYCGSVAVDSSRTVLAVSAPRGGLVAFWDLQRDLFLGTRTLSDACGLAPSGETGGFLITSGLGAVLHGNPLTGARRLLVGPRATGEAWDNHLLRVAA